MKPSRGANRCIAALGLALAVVARCSGLAMEGDEPPPPQPPPPSEHAPEPPVEPEPAASSAAHRAAARAPLAASAKRREHWSLVGKGEDFTLEVDFPQLVLTNKTVHAPMFRDMETGLSHSRVSGWEYALCSRAVVWTWIVVVWENM